MVKIQESCLLPPSSPSLWSAPSFSFSTLPMADAHAPSHHAPSHAPSLLPRANAASAASHQVVLTRLRASLFAHSLDAIAHNAESNAHAYAQHANALARKYVQGQLPASLLAASRELASCRAQETEKLRTKANALAMARASAHATANAAAMAKHVRHEVTARYASLQALTPTSEAWKRVADAVRLAAYKDHNKDHQDKSQAIHTNSNVQGTAGIPHRFVPKHTSTSKQGSVRVLAVCRIVFADVGGENAKLADAAAVPWSPMRHYEHARSTRGGMCKERGMFLHAPHGHVDRLLLFGVHGDDHVVQAAPRVFSKVPTARGTRADGALRRLVLATPSPTTPVTLHTSWQAGTVDNTYEKRCADAEACAFRALQGEATSSWKTTNVRAATTRELARYAAAHEPASSAVDDVMVEPMSLAASGGADDEQQQQQQQQQRDDGTFMPLHHVILCRMLTNDQDGGGSNGNDNGDCVVAADPSCVVPEFLVTLYLSSLSSDISDEDALQIASSVVSSSPSQTNANPSSTSPQQQQRSPSPAPARATATRSPTDRRTRPASGRSRGNAALPPPARRTPTPTPTQASPPSPASVAHAASAAAVAMVSAHGGPEELSQALAAYDRANAEALAAEIEAHVQRLRVALETEARRSDAEVELSETLALNIQFALDEVTSNA